MCLGRVCGGGSAWRGQGSIMVVLHDIVIRHQRAHSLILNRLICSNVFYLIYSLVRECAHMNQGCMQN